MGRPNRKSDKKKTEMMRNYARYSGMAFQIFAAILIGVFIGKKLDAYFQLERSYFTAACSLLFLLAGLYLSLKDLLFNSKK